jgi:hypothetical protein
LLEELLAGSGKLGGFLFHLYEMKDTMLRNGMQEQTDKTSNNCLELKAALLPGEKKGYDQFWNHERQSHSRRGRERVFALSAQSLPSPLHRRSRHTKRLFVHS